MASKSQMAQSIILPISDNCAGKPPLEPTSLKVMTYGNILATSKARPSSSPLENDKPTKYKDFTTTQQSKRPTRIVSTISRERSVESPPSIRERRKHKKDREDVAPSSSGERTFYREELDKMNELEHQRIHQLKQVRRRRPPSKENKQQSKGADSESLANPKMAKNNSMDDSRKQHKSKKKRSRKEPCKSSERVRRNSDQIEVSEKTAFRHDPNEAPPKPTRSRHSNESQESEKRHLRAPTRGKKAGSQHSSRNNKATVWKGYPKKKRPRHVGEVYHSSTDKEVKALSTERPSLQTGSGPLEEQWSYVSDMNPDCISEIKGRLARLIDQFEANPSEPPRIFGSEPKDPSGQLIPMSYPSNLSCKKSQYSSKSMFDSEPKDPSGHVMQARSPSNLSCKKAQYSNNRGTKKKTVPRAKNKKRGPPQGRILSASQGKNRRDEEVPKVKKERKPKQKSPKKKVPSSVVVSLSIESREIPEPSQIESKASSTAGSSAMFTSSCESTERFGAPLISEIERRTEFVVPVGVKQIEKDSTKDSVQGFTSLKHHEATFNNACEEANKRIWLGSFFRRHPSPHDPMETANRKDYSQGTAPGSSGELSRSLELLLSHSHAGGKTKDFRYVASKRRMTSERFKAKKQADRSTRWLTGRYRALESDIKSKNRKTEFEEAKQPWYLRTSNNSMADYEAASEHRIMHMVFFDSVDDASTTREGAHGQFT